MQKNINTDNIIRWMLTGAVFTTLVLSLFALQQIAQLDKATTLGETKLQAEIQKVKFCHNKQIATCDDASIQEWNTNHPEDAFSIPQL